jgi:hypothetical protein
MAVYMDTPVRNDETGPKCFHNREFSHLSADTETELRVYAKSIAMPVRWIQDPGQPSFHFDVTGQWLKYCLADPTVEKIDKREFVNRVRVKRGLNPLATRPEPVPGALDFGSGFLVEDSSHD